MAELAKRAGIALALVLTFAALLWFAPGPLCPSRRLFGLDCPGCGLTRATFALIRGDIAEMWRFHPLAIPTLTFFAWLVVRVGILGGDEGRPLSRREQRISTAAAILLAGALIVVYIARALGAWGGLPDTLG